MALQTKVYGALVDGIVGEFSDGAPKTARAYLTYGVNSLPGKFGCAFSFDEKTIDSATGTVITTAKQGVDSSSKGIGILVNPKEHYVVGFKTARTLPADGLSATIATRGHIWVYTDANTTAGGLVYAKSDGTLTPTSASATLLKGARWLRTTKCEDMASSYPAYSSTSKAYAVGDKVSNGGKYYVVTEKITASANTKFADLKVREVKNIPSEVLSEVEIDIPTV